MGVLGNLAIEVINVLSNRTANNLLSNRSAEGIEWTVLEGVPLEYSKLTLLLTDPAGLWGTPKVTEGVFAWSRVSCYNDTGLRALERGTELLLPRCLSARPRVIASLGLYPDVLLVTSDRACTFPKGTELISSGAEWQTKAVCLPAQASCVLSPETDGRSHLDLETVHRSAGSVTQPRLKSHRCTCEVLSPVPQGEEGVINKSLSLTFLTSL